MVHKTADAQLIETELGWQIWLMADDFGGYGGFSMSHLKIGTQESCLHLAENVLEIRGKSLASPKPLGYKVLC